jgi:hypothetical protein
LPIDKLVVLTMDSEPWKYLLKDEYVQDASRCHHRH